MVNTDLALLAHLMRRAGFGATRDELESLASQDYEAVVEDLLHPERFPEVDDDVVIRYWLELNNPDSVEPWNTRWIYRMVNTQRPLEEKMALFWHHVFATSVGKSEHGPSAKTQIELFRTNAIADMRTILVDLAKDPAMIFWLDNCENFGDRPNENWGRELLELFSMGVGNYTEDDIKMASRAFTGWTFTQPIPLDPYGRYPSEFVYREQDHDDSEKTFLGRAGSLQRRGHHRHNRPAARHRQIHIAPPVQLLRSRRAAGAVLERRPAPGPAGHRNPLRRLLRQRRRHPRRPARPVQLRLLQAGALQKGQESRLNSSPARSKLAGNHDFPEPSLHGAPGRRRPHGTAPYDSAHRRGLAHRRRVD